MFLHSTSTVCTTSYENEQALHSFTPLEQLPFPEPDKPAKQNIVITTP